MRTIGYVIVGLLATGCAAPGSMFAPAPVGETPGDASRTEVLRPASTGNPTGDAVTPNGASSPESLRDLSSNNGEVVESDRELDELLARLKAENRLTPQELAELARDLRSVPPSLRPMMVGMLRSTVADEASPAPVVDPLTAEAPSPTFVRQAGYSAPASMPLETRSPAPPQAVPVMDAPLNDLSPGNPLREMPTAYLAGDSSQTADPYALPASATMADVAKAAIEQNAAYDAVLGGGPNGLESPAVMPSEATGESGSSDMQAAGADVPAKQWKDALTEAIARLEVQRHQHSSDADPNARARVDAVLRLLYLAAGRREEAVRPVDQLSEAEQEFWTHQMHALATWLDPNGTPVASRRAALSLHQLRGAVAELASLSSLSVHNMAFCTDVWGYGRYAEFEKYEFEPGEPVLLYVEIDNFAAEEVKEGFSTSIETSYQILDASGHMVADHTFQLQEEVCRQRRRDYYTHYEMHLPKRINPGRYALQLTVEDSLGKKFGQSVVHFTILAESR